LIDLLDDLNVRRNTVIAVLADHGESLGEHDYFFEHGDFGAEAEIHVPLILADSERIPRGVRVRWTVQSLDVAPTLLDLIGVPPDPGLRGTTLMPLVESTAGEHRLCFGETGRRFHDENDRREVDGVAGKWRWVREGRFKLTHVPRADGPPARRLYDLDSDPGETSDVAGRFPEVADRLGAKLDLWMAEDDGLERDYHISDEVREELRALGYID
jgi:arylsulfatase A-like enzyme